MTMTPSCPAASALSRNTLASSADPATVRGMLNLLGYQEVLVYPKTRETWHFTGVIVAVDESGKLVGENFYWLSTKPETLDWAKSNWYTTPTISYADFTALGQLPKVNLNVSVRNEKKGEDEVTRIMVENPTKSLAFFVRLKVDKGKGGDEILPVLWQDNYISLLPGEKREITASYRAAELGSAAPFVEVKGWNTE